MNRYLSIKSVKETFQFPSQSEKNSTEKVIKTFSEKLIKLKLTQQVSRGLIAATHRKQLQAPERLQSSCDPGMVPR
jgi:hypothetical protein